MTKSVGSFIPPVASGWIRKDNKWFHEACTVRINAVSHSASKPEAETTSRPILLVTKDSSSKFECGPTIQTLTPPLTSLSLSLQSQHAHTYRAQHAQMTAGRLYNTPFVTGTVLRCRVISRSLDGYWTYRKAWYPVSAVCLGLLWHQLSFFVHDLGRMDVTHNRVWDRLMGVLFASYVGGLSVGWWVDTHNTHHLVTNHPSHDPDIQHVPFFAISCLPLISLL